ncbi:hypothetical protein VOLCADRAFT_103403 [Volvox carteri f. nagariensis]|uniref:ABC transmembrane type-1 domain-containing protein n=1 Tax=Volvox carteri f. nagariensis TaxID=3068 RepID=D8TLM3_VOLCA|nr:uncharacterized protein VOLCADRAFT_103403 [Volvox carteri f. nagariensis]EFJ51759.1 hypothetical protein VOLCADRAFT_103403 [Volvox carteri f. nagariensis]|eukprot:XP_002947169.1 hypothetical protein VOLCADRAFT_103403 [Volvox carteri f. nagariensis]
MTRTKSLIRLPGYGGILHHYLRWGYVIAVKCMHGAYQAVAAKFPAVPVLPNPPESGSLQDVVPYLLRLALQERHLAWRLAAAVCCMVVAKLAGISLPLVFKSAVDAMSVSGGSAAVMDRAALTAVSSSRAMHITRAPIFAPVSQAVTRRVAYHTFAHVLNLDTKFHIDRRTGRVSRILERGTRSIGVLYRALIFTFLPTGLELGAVAGLLASRFGALLAGLLAATFAAYVTWTEVNHLDNQASSKAVDALLNFETVTLFNNQRLEDTALYYDSIRENIRYGRPDAHDEEVEAAARMARLHDTVMALPDQYDTVSISLASASLVRGRSALFVAHRLSTVRNCDRIVVLRNGLVVEEGSHDELMARRGEYAAMWQLQAAAAKQEDGEKDEGGATDSDNEMYDMEEGGETLREADQGMVGPGAAAAAPPYSLDDLDAGTGSGR